MCTCITFKTRDNYFGRTLDLDYNFDEKIVITPRNYNFILKSKGSFRTKYAFVGIASVVDTYPLYAEATNEMGLSIAGLAFPESAYYQKIEEGKMNITPFELTPWILGNFSSIEELRKVIHDVNIIDISFSEDILLTPLHWMVSDKRECIVLEPTKEGLNIYSNPIGVLTNNPPFPYHLTNINNYLNLTPDITENHFSNKVNLHSYGLGMGAIGLPGDNSPASRFVRAAFNKLNSICETDEESSVSQFFHILDTVIVVRGTTQTENKKWSITTYTCCVNVDRGIYYYKTYHNNQITAIRLTSQNMNSKYLTTHDLENYQRIRYIN